MRITAIKDIVVPISSSIRNAYIDFSTMDVSVVAVFTDVRRDGRPVIGFGFNSNGRYAPKGLLRDRFIPRLLAAAPESLQDERGLIDPAKAWDAMMRNEKPGGHGERRLDPAQVLVEGHEPDLHLHRRVAPVEVGAHLVL